MGFGVLLRRYRLRAGQTQEELAHRSGISPRTISLLETGRRRAPRMASARLLIDALNLSPEEGAALLGAVHGTAPAASAGVGLQRFLPSRVPDFTGREAELRRVVEAARQADPPGVVVIDGMAGVGKTSLAVAAGHGLAAAFPDGQYFLDLRGHAPGRPPLSPPDALAALLRMAGLEPERIPPTAEGRAAAWRAAVAGRRVLTVLDDAAGVEQIHPLLPGAGVVLVTSRARLFGPAGGVSFSLDVPPPAEACALFGRVAGERAACAGPGVVAEIVELLGRLPLAVRLAAARLASRPCWTAVDLLVRLRDDTRRLAELEVVGAGGVADAFESSLRDADAEQRRMVGLLARHFPADFDPSAVAALAGLPQRQVEYVLERLVDRHLLRQPGRGRYAMHVLLRDHLVTRPGALAETRRGRDDAYRLLSRPA